MGNDTNRGSILFVRHLCAFDVQVDPLLLVDLAAFVGLNCTSIQANEVWRRQAYARLPDSYNSYGLSVEMLTWMNDTMSKLLPEEMLIQYDLPST